MSDTTLVVVAHPEPRSFTGSWAKTSAQVSSELGHIVHYSDLVADGFNPVESALCYSDSSVQKESPPFDPLKAQEQAAQAGNLPEDVAAEMKKIMAADRLIIHFPIWWFGPPAILKGWLDRCLAHGAMHNVDERFDKGRCSGKKVMLCVSTGASTAECSYNGKESDINMLLWPVAYTFRYLGFTVLRPQVVNGVHGYFEGDEETALERRLGDLLEQHKETIRQFDAQPLLKFNADTDFDEAGRLKESATSHSAFIRHAK